MENAHRERYLSHWSNRARRRFGALPRSRQGTWLHLAGDTGETLRGGALLVGSHFGCGLLTPLALTQLEIEMWTIAHTPRGGHYESPLVHVLDLSRVAPLDVAIAARSVLRRGGVVFVAGDLSVDGADDRIAVSVLGRPRRIARGFAELSISSSVPATPIFSRVDPSGTISTWIEPGLSATAGQNRRTQAAELAQGYADRLSANFARFPGSVTPGAMRSHFAAAPRGGSGASAR